MKTRFLLPVLLLAATWAFAQGSKSQPEDLSASQQHEPPMLGLHWARGFNPAFRADEASKKGAHTKSADMTYHGGIILPSVAAQAIFWGPSWTNASFVSDKISGIDSWYPGFSGSNYAKTSDEYTGSNGQVGPTVSYGGHFIDTTAAASGSSTSAILAEVCKVIPSPVSNGYYPVYVDVPRGHAGYCAYHSYGSCGSTQVQFAFFFNLDGDAGCDPQDTSRLHSQGLAALANVSGHELSEARTDPASPGAWYDSHGAENGDKCVWTFGVPLVTFSNGSKWKIQGEWSNAAYTAGTSSAGCSATLSGLLPR